MKKSVILFAISLFLFCSSVKALTKAPVDVTKMSIDEILDAFDKGYLNSELLVNIYIERIKAYDSMFNSINQLNENALIQARELDKERESGNIRGRLHGVPILVKCNIDVYGLPTTAGTKSLSDNYPKENATVVQKLIDEGAIILGSTNMSELAFSAANSYSSYGYVRNVFNVSYTSYGSSGGAAVAVRAAFAVASLGTDTNSSVRLPATGAGLVGIRPTYGLVSRSGVIPYDYERDTVGILSRDVSDSALLLSIISGEDKNDKVTKGSVAYSGDVTDTSLEGVNIGVAMQYVKGSSNSSGVLGKTDNDIYKLTMESIEKLKKQGANIIYLDDFVKSSNLTIASNTYAGGTMCDYFNEYIEGTNGKIRSFEQLAKSSGHVQNLSGYFDACGVNIIYKNKRDERKKVYRDYVKKYYDENELDVILYPTLKNKVFEYTKTGNISPGSSLGSVIGYPSITVPMGFINEFSYGIEFLGKNNSEKVLYNVANEFEKVNENKIDSSILTPSLYTISEEVEKLKTLYEKALENKYHVKSEKQWIKDVKTYFQNYNMINNHSEEAEKLINNYNDFNNEILDSVNELLNNKKVEYFVLIIGWISLIIFIKEFSKCFR